MRPAGLTSDPPLYARVGAPTISAHPPAVSLHPWLPSAGATATARRRGPPPSGERGGPHSRVGEERCQKAATDGRHTSPKRLRGWSGVRNRPRMAAIRHQRAFLGRWGHGTGRPRPVPCPTNHPRASPANQPPRHSRHRRQPAAPRPEPRRRTDPDGAPVSSYRATADHPAHDRRPYRRSGSPHHAASRSGGRTRS